MAQRRKHLGDLVPWCQGWSLTHPDEIGAYVTAREHLFSIAVRGKAARALVKDAMAAIGESDGSG